MGITIALYPFAKKMTDDGLRHSVSKKSFEIIHGTGSRNFGLIYAFLVMVAAIPLGCVYLLYRSDFLLKVILYTDHEKAIIIALVTDLSCDIPPQVK